MKVTKKRTVELIEIDEADWHFMFCEYIELRKKVKTKQDLKCCKVLCELFFKNIDRINFDKNPANLKLKKSELLIVANFFDNTNVKYYAIIAHELIAFLQKS
jgi:hypothetical protein